MFCRQKPAKYYVPSRLRSPITDTIGHSLSKGVPLSQRGGNWDRESGIFSSIDSFQWSSREIVNCHFLQTVSMNFFTHRTASDARSRCGHIPGRGGSVNSSRVGWVAVGFSKWTTLEALPVKRDPFQVAGIQHDSIKTTWHLKISNRRFDHGQSLQFVKPYGVCLYTGFYGPCQAFAISLFTYVPLIRSIWKLH